MYLVLLIVGIGFIVVTLVVGELIEFEGASLSVLRPSVLAVICATVGAFGLFMGDYFSTFVVLPLSLAVGLGVGLFLAKCIIDPLHKLQNTSTVDQQSLIGYSAKVDQQIAQGGYGRIVYTVHGSRVSSPAKTVDGSGLSAGSMVEIIYIEDKTFYVSLTK